jgi:hypothetical protein
VLGHLRLEAVHLQVDDREDLLAGQLVKTMTSSIRFSSSGRKTFFSSPMIRSFISS